MGGIRRTHEHQRRRRERSGVSSLKLTTPDDDDFTTVACPRCLGRGKVPCPPTFATRTGMGGDNGHGGWLVPQVEAHTPRHVGLSRVEGDGEGRARHRNTSEGVSGKANPSENFAERVANAARVCACVNACAGMADPAAEIARLRSIVEDAKAANLIGEDGKLRKVLGTLPVTADGCVVGECSSELWWFNGEVIAHSGTGRCRVDDLDERPVEHTYSTREAAEAARVS